jgi:G:T-mismatch repair DNA endonuclease (very short patch repair protein)
MFRIGPKIPVPQIAGRSMLHDRCFRFRLSWLDLLGMLHIGLLQLGVAVLERGCFWHGH